MINSHKLSASESPDNFNMMSDESNCLWHVKAAGESRSATRRGGSGAAGGAAAAGAALAPRPPRALSPLAGAKPNLQAPRGKSVFSDRGRKKQEGLETVSRHGLVVSVSHCRCTQCRDVEGWGL